MTTPPTPPPPEKICPDGHTPVGVISGPHPTPPLYTGPHAAYEVCGGMTCQETAYCRVLAETGSNGVFRAYQPDVDADRAARLTEIRGDLAAAVHGPWVLGQSACGESVLILPEPWATGEGHTPRFTPTAYHYQYPDIDTLDTPTAHLIAQAPEHIAFLLDLVAELAAALPHPNPDAAS